MPKIVFVQPDGAARTLEAPVGISVMEVARQQAVPGVVARCGGACACATCHVYVDPAWMSKLTPPEDMELGMLEAAWEPRRNSRLSCQLQLTQELDGLRVTVPAKQAP
jgi:2Fe-2S ferredoxin